MPAPLTFALGINSAAFAAGLNTAKQSLLGFIVSVLSLKIVGDKVQEVFRTGADLFDFSMRAGASAEEIYRLSAAFTATVGSAANIPLLLNTINRALAGTDEEIGNAVKGFQALNISVADFKKLGATERIVALANALAKANPETAALAAQRIAGRGGALDLLAISAQAGAFTNEARANQRGAKVFGRAAAEFDEIIDSINRLQNKAIVPFVYLAQASVPAISGFVKEFETMVDVITDALEMGEIPKLFSMTLKMMWLGILSDIQIGFVGIFGLIEDGLNAVTQWLNPFWEYLSNQIIKFLAKIKLIDAEGLNPPPVAPKSKPFDFGLADTMERWMRENEAAWEAFDEFLRDLEFGAGLNKPGGKGGKGIFMPDELEFSSRERPDVTWLERVGAVFGGSSAALDHQRTIARNTGQTNQLLVTTNQIMNRVASGMEGGFKNKL
jgi:hypothetical protein